MKIKETKNQLIITEGLFDVIGIFLVVSLAMSAFVTLCVLDCFGSYLQSTNDCNESGLLVVTAFKFSLPISFLVLYLLFKVNEIKLNSITKKVYWYRHRFLSKAILESDVITFEEIRSIAVVETNNDWESATFEVRIITNTRDLALTTHVTCSYNHCLKIAEKLSSWLKKKGVKISENF